MAGVRSRNRRFDTDPKPTCKFYPCTDKCPFGLDGNISLTARCVTKRTKSPGNHYSRHTQVIQKIIRGDFMESLGKKLMLGGSMAAMLAAITAQAQAQEQTENVTVSASRI